ncbi:unnamed protein product [Peniophora sp. CBMAI 1063]|nr:unnamed protein product [Peniophora sp. CBMAI 1063]
MIDARNESDAPLSWSPTEPLTPLDSDDDVSPSEPQARQTADVREVLDAVCGLLEDVELCEAERKSWAASTGAAQVGCDRGQGNPASSRAYVGPSPPSTPHTAPSPPDNARPSSSRMPTEERRGRGARRGQTHPREPRFRSCSAGATSPQRAEYRPPPRQSPMQTATAPLQRPPPSHGAASVCDESTQRSAGSDSEPGPQPDAPASSGAKRKRGDKKANRQRKRAKGDVGGAQAAQADGAGGRAGGSEDGGKAPKQKTAKEKAYKQRRKALKRAQARADAARAKPYDRLHDESKYYARPRTVKLVNLKTFEVRYATQRGGYNSFSYKDKKVYTVQDLKKRGFKELPWDGNDTVAILDNKNRLICVLLGPPKRLSEEEKLSWENSMVELAKTLEQARVKHTDAFAEDGKYFDHDRGVFAAFATGFTASNGKTVRIYYVHFIRHRAVAEELLKDGNMRRVAAFASEALAYYFPLVYKHLRERLRALCEAHPELRFPFEGLSIYPTVTFNLGPVSVTYGHNDGTNYAGIPCSITALGSFKAEEGGHLILFDLRLYIKFPAGRTILLLSAGLRHGNTQLAPGDKRYSVTQYCQGSLIRWVAYGFRKSGDFTAAEKDAMDEAAGEGWAAQLGRFSTWKSLPEDRRAVVDWERGQALKGA